MSIKAQSSDANINSSFEFTADNIKRAENIVAKYPEGRQKSALLPLLDIAQRQNGGWLSTPTIEYVANYLSLPYIRAHEVASFYTMFNLKPVGKYHIQICGTTPCWLCGSDDITKNFEKETGAKKGGTSEDGLFTITEVECLGACTNAPMVQINDDYHENLTKETVQDLVAKMKSGKVPAASAKKAAPTKKAADTKKAASAKRTTGTTKATPKKKVVANKAKKQGEKL